MCEKKKQYSFEHDCSSFGLLAIPKGIVVDKLEIV